MCIFDGSILGAGATGLFMLNTGNTDNAADIDAYFKTRSSLLEYPGKKKNRFIYLNVKTSGTVKVTPIVDGVSGTPIVFTPSDTENHYMKMSVSRDNLGYYWAYKVESVDGCSFTIDEITVLPMYLSKRKE